MLSPREGPCFKNQAEDLLGALLKLTSDLHQCMHAPVCIRTHYSHASIYRNTHTPTCIGTHSHTCTLYTHLHIQEHSHTYMYIRKLSCVHKDTLIHMHVVYMPAYIGTLMHLCIVHISVYMRTLIHLHVQRHTHTLACYITHIIIIINKTPNPRHI